MTTVAQARGVVAGAAILTLFGNLWAFLALVFWDARPRWSLPASNLVATLLLAFCLARFVAWRKIPSADDPIAAARGKRAGMWFGIIFSAEGLLIALASLILTHFGLSSWIPIAAAKIIGLHFFPLARIFGVPLYYGTGALTLLGISACYFISDPAQRTLCAGLIMAAILWLTALVLLIRTNPTPSA